MVHVSVARVGSLAAPLAFWRARHSWSLPVFIGDGTREWAGPHPTEAAPAIERKSQGIEHAVPI